MSPTSSVRSVALSVLMQAALLPAFADSPSSDRLRAIGSAPKTAMTRGHGGQSAGAQLDKDLAAAGREIGFIPSTSSGSNSLKAGKDATSMREIGYMAPPPANGGPAVIAPTRR